ncbi:single-stranded-DNA-specific exonuclease RecJ [Galenea microaerophila]
MIERQTAKPIYEAAKQLGLSDLQAKLVANRLNPDTDPDWPETLKKIVFPKLKHIQPPTALKNAQKAAELIADAIEGEGQIVLATDYDTDGVTSAWVGTRALIDYFDVPPERITHVIGERKTGYGITDEVVERILNIEQPIELVITADQGSSDEPRIQKLAQAGIKVCVTDHHQMAIEGPPPSAVCTVNPQQAGCNYDKTVAGCYVLFLVMSQVRRVLIERGKISADTPTLKNLALNVALGTVADSVSLKSPNNRAIVLAGLAQINQFTVPAWQAMRQFHDNQNQPFNAEYLGFQVATRINAASRVSNVNTAFQFLNANSISEALLALQQLDEDNAQRKLQQQAMLDQANAIAQALYHPNKYSLAIKMTGNAGIQGIIASRIGERYGVPTVAMTDLEDGYLAGSGRGIVPSVDLREAFQWMSEQDSELFKSMGGHKGAAGCMIPIEKYEVFADLFEQAIQQQLGKEAPCPIIETDGTLPDQWLTPALIEELNQLEPYGREWPQPVFSGTFLIDQVKAVGQTQTHLSFRLVSESGQRFSAIFFNAKQDADEPTTWVPGEKILCAYQPALNTFYGRTSLQLRILAID